MSTPKTPARQIYTSIRVPCTEKEYTEIKRAAKLRGSPSLAAWLRERGACFGLADGLEALAVREEALDALRALLEAHEAYHAKEDVVARSVGYGVPQEEWAAYLAARDAYYAARARAREVAR